MWASRSVTGNNTFPRCSQAAAHSVAFSYVIFVFVIFTCFLSVWRATATFVASTEQIVVAAVVGPIIIRVSLGPGLSRYECVRHFTIFPGHNDLKFPTWGFPRWMHCLGTVLTLRALEYTSLFIDSFSLFLFSPLPGEIAINIRPSPSLS